MFKEIIELLKRFAVLGSPRGETAAPTKLCPSCHAIMRIPRCELCRYEERLYKEITLADYFMGRDEDPQFRTEMRPEFRTAARTLLGRCNALLERVSKAIPTLATPKVNSGWRPPAINAQFGGKPNSKHLICQAVDIGDAGQHLSGYLLKNPQLLEEFDLAMEHPSATPTWCHLQFPPPASGRRVFYP
jgi:hypothetical protein